MFSINFPFYTTFFSTKSILFVFYSFSSFSPNIIINAILLKTNKLSIMQNTIVISSFHNINIIVIRRIFHRISKCYTNCIFLIIFKSILSLSRNLYVNRIIFCCLYMRYKSFCIITNFTSVRNNNRLIAECYKI